MLRYSCEHRAACTRKHSQRARADDSSGIAVRHSGCQSIGALRSKKRRVAHLHFRHQISSLRHFAFTLPDLGKLPRQACSLKLYMNFPLGNRAQCLHTHTRTSVVTILVGRPSFFAAAPRGNTAGCNTSDSKTKLKHSHGSAPFSCRSLVPGRCTSLPVNLSRLVVFTVWLG